MELLDNIRVALPQGTCATLMWQGNTSETPEKKLDLTADSPS
jgi:hypothetical protein